MGEWWEYYGEDTDEEEPVEILTGEVIVTRDREVGTILGPDGGALVVVESPFGFQKP